MFAQLPHSSAARLIAALAVALGLGIAGGAATPAGADESQWVRPQSNWNQGSGWNRQWRSQTQSQSSNRSQVVIGGAPGVIITSPNFAYGNSGFIVRQPGFIVGRPSFGHRSNFFV